LSSGKNELGSLKIASQTRVSRRTVVIWGTPDNDDTEVERFVPVTSLMIVLEEKNEYYRVIIENNHVGWIHKDNTEDADD